ncbi:pseudouridine synthase [Massilia sp. W12]|uniref:pseudouridine synthase n=1 Tax=Massilia sp. W12 TaxID=3126507 RepID=UPI0030D093CC
MAVAHHPPSPLPLRDGVAASFLWLPPGAWPDLLHFLCARFDKIDAAIWQARFAAGEVVAQDGRILQADTPYQPGMRIFYYRDPGPETPLPFTETILYQDAHLLVADKPHFMPVAPVGRFLRETLQVRLRRRTGLAELSPLHRIDRETAGLVAFSCNPATRGAYQNLFARRAVEKDYLAVAPLLSGRATPFEYASRIETGERFFTMREVAGEANALTRISVLAQDGPWALYRLQPHTGRTHQLRVQMAALGAPLLHDALYPQVLPENSDDFSKPLQLLAQQLRFRDPLTDQPHHFVSTLRLRWPLSDKCGFAE